LGDTNPKVETFRMRANVYVDESTLGAIVLVECLFQAVCPRSEERFQDEVHILYVVLMREEERIAMGTTQQPIVIGELGLNAFPMQKLSDVESARLNNVFDSPLAEGWLVGDRAITTLG
jgi:hypothetical protein